jgi:sugar (pentulose or hexulose) kinase
MSHIAVIDVGKTNAKLALVDANLREIAVVTRPNQVLQGPPWPHIDLEGHWQFFLHHLAEFHARWGVDAISVTTHGAAAVLLDAQGALAAPMLDYEHGGPDDLADDYDAIRPDFAQTGSPRLPRGLNLGAQLHWMFAQDADLGARTAHLLTYPQYWGWRLTGQMACDLCSLGCHTDLWLPGEGQFSPLVDRLGLTGKIAPPRKPQEVLLGQLRPALALQTGLRPDTRVSVGIHDSNASLYPYLARQGAFSVVSTGTWVVAMAIGGADVAPDPGRDVLINVAASGQAVPSARFMGGREYEMIRQGRDVTPDKTAAAAVLAGGIMLLPAVQQGSGPFPDARMRWTPAPQTEAQEMLALSWYLALMTRSCLDLTGAKGPVIVEGPFARNRDYLAMLAAVSPDGVAIAPSATGTSAGAAMLALPAGRAPATQAVHLPENASLLREYAASWAGAARENSLTKG